MWSGRNIPGKRTTFGRGNTGTIPEKVFGSNVPSSTRPLLVVPGGLGRLDFRSAAAAELRVELQLHSALGAGLGLDALAALGAKFLARGKLGLAARAVGRQRTGELVVDRRQQPLV